MLPLVTRTVALIETLPVEVQVAPVMLPPPPGGGGGGGVVPPPLGVAEAAFELVTTPLTVFLIQNQYVVPLVSPVAVKVRALEATVAMRTRPAGSEFVSR